MGLFKVENQLPIINPEIRAIPALKSIITRDKDRNKGTAFAELLYIYFVYDYKTPYAKYGIDERKVKAQRAAGLSETWKEDKIIKAAVKLYVDLQETPAVKSLKHTRDALLTSSDVIIQLRKMIDESVLGLHVGAYVERQFSEDEFDTIEDLDAARKSEAEYAASKHSARNDEIASLVDQVKLLITISAKLPEAISAIEKLEEQVKQEQASGRKFKGKTTVGLFEE